MKRRWASKRERAVLVTHAEHGRAPRAFDWRAYEASGTAQEWFADFQRNWTSAEQLGVDAIGGDEWRRTIALAVMARAAADPVRAERWIADLLYLVATAGGG